MSANRDLSLKRRDLIRPDLNKHYASLCNPSTTIPTFLFGDDLNKEVEELTKSKKLSNKVTPKQRVEPYKVPGGRGKRGRGRFSHNSGRGKTPSPLVFFSARPGPSMAPSKPQSIVNQDPVGSSEGVSQSSIASIIANQTPFKAGGLQESLHMW